MLPVRRLRDFSVAMALVWASVLFLASLAIGQSKENVANAKPAAVRVWQDTIELPTYEQGMPNENPPFD